MLRLAVLFVGIALMAALFGFGDVAAYSLTGAKLLFCGFLLVAVIAALDGALRQPLY